MQNKNAFYIPVVMAACIATGLFIGSSLGTQQPTAVGMSSDKAQKIEDILHILDQRYVDSVDVTDVYEQAISDMLHNLDPHSNYISATEVQRAEESIRGEFHGIGVRFFVIRDTLSVTNVLKDSPSERAGLESGDKIIKIDTANVASVKITTEDVMKKLKGPEGTKVNLKILRKGKVLDKTVTRGAIFVESVVAPYMVSNDVGYLKINSFSINTSKEFRLATTRLLEQGMKKIIIDLRNNGGGVLQCATDIADEFIGADKLLLVTQGLHEARSEYRATNRGMLEDIDVAVLINSQSASASEILAGALQDNDKGTIIGRRSFGKGLVQEDRQLADGSVLRLTIARYYTPTGRCIQREYNGDFHDYTTETYDRYESGEMYELDSSSFVNKKKFTTPEGKTVYGGGGIFPDVFVPLDSIGFTSYFNQLRYSDAFICFAFDYVQNKRTKWKSPAAYAKSFVVNDGLMRQFLNYAEEHNAVPVDEQSMKKSRKLIAKVLKAEIANQIWMEDGYYRVINESDNEVREALKMLK
jgi:carboxyl-terminal processing protease